MMVADGDECCSDNNVYDSSSDMDTTMDEVAELNENLATDKIIAAELDEEPDDAVHCWLLLSSQGIIVNESNDETWEQRLTPLQVRMCRLSVSNKHIGDRVQCGKSLATGIILELHMYTISACKHYGSMVTKHGMRRKRSLVCAGALFFSR